jgi:hypothetical protein
VIASIPFILSAAAALAAIGVGIVGVMLGALALVLAGPDSAPIALPVRPTAMASAVIGLIVFIAGANFLCSLAMAA